MRSWVDDVHFPQGHITAVAQTPDGYLWLGSYGGLARFDGVHFVVFDRVNAPALQDGRISALQVATDGALWIGHENGNVTRFAGGKFTVARPEPARGDGEGIARLVEDAAGGMWAVGMRGSLAPVMEAFAGQPGGVDSIDAVADRAGVVWLARNGTLFRRRAAALERVATATNWATDTVFGLGASPGGGIWLSNEGRLQRWEDGRRAEDWGPAPWGTQTLTALVELRDGTIAAGTSNHGLYLWTRGEPIRNLNAETGLGQNWVRSVFEDREGTLWIGTGGAGLLSVRDTTFAIVQPPDAWQGRSVLAVSPAADGGVWVGTEGAGVYHFAGGRWRHFGDAEGLANLFVWTLVEDAAGELLAGTWGGGIYRLGRDGRFQPESRIPPAGPVTAAGRSVTRPLTWFGSPGVVRGIGASDARGTPPVEARLDLPAAVSAADVRTVAEDGAGRLWIGTLGSGLFVREPAGNMRHLGAAEGLPSDTVQCLWPATDGGVWIGTADGGIAQWRDRQMRVVDSRHGLPSNSIGQIIPDDQGYLWLASLAGIFRVRQSDLERCAAGTLGALPLQLFGRSDGLPAIQTAGGQGGACRTPDGLVWFCTTKGLVRVDSRRVPVNLLPPPVVIEQVMADGRAVDPAAPLRLAAGTQRLQVQFASLSLAAPEKVLLRTRLRGLNDRWNDASAEREVVYYHLPPGDYHLEVAGSNNDGVWSVAPAGLAFEVLPFYWQTWWFRGALILLVLGAASLAGIWGARARLRRRLAALARESAVERERTRIARDIHDDLGSSLTRIGLLTQSALAHAAPAGPARDLAEIHETVRELARSLDEIIWAVSPHHDSLDSMANFLGRYAQDFLRVTGVRCRLALPGNLPAIPVTAEIRHHVYLATKEALHNIVKHAGASEVRFGLEHVAGTLRVTIEDDGRGFRAAPAGREAAAASGHGQGLPNLARRLAEIGGVCTVESRVGNGTQTIFVIPLTT